MASINLTGILRDPTGEFSHLNKIRFTHSTNTGQTLKGFRSVHEIAADGAYDIDLEYGNIFIETLDHLNKDWINQGHLTINSDTPATDLPSLLGITTPATDADLLVFQALVEDANQYAQDAESSAVAAAASEGVVQSIIDDLNYSNTTAGLVWDSTTDTYRRTGSSNFTLIQKQMKRCVLNVNGTVNYFLNPNNSNFKSDGVTPSVLDGTDGNVMVQIPKFYYKYTVVGSAKKVEVSQTPQTGFAVHPAFIKDAVEVDYRYYRAYEGFIDTGVLKSISGVTPTRSVDFPTFRTYAVANGAGWHLTDWQLLHAVQILYLVEFGTFNSQSVLGQGNSLGGDYGVTTGLSNSLGNQSSDASNSDWMSYRGIENFYSDIWEMIDGINIREREVFLNNDYNTFASDVFAGDYVSTGLTLPSASASYIRDVNFGGDGFLFTNVSGAGSSTYITDGAWSSTGDRVFYLGGAADGAICGAFYSSAYDDSSKAGVVIGAAVSF